MKLYASAVLTLLPFTILAVPTSEAAAPIAIKDIGLHVSSAPRSTRLAARSNQLCKIIDTEYWAHCRSGPGTNFLLTHFVFTNIDYEFSCYSTGTCVDDNCNWDKLIWNGGSCFVSAYLTDDRCSVATLPAC